MLTQYPPFRPRRFLKSSHAQTLGAFVLRGKRGDYTGTSYRVDLSDGDQLVIHDDQPNSWITGDRITILFHGLCGCHLAPYVVRATEKLNRLGIRTIRVDMRGFGDSTLVSKSHLHGGCSGDARDVINFVRQLSPLSPISLVGYSIGGNIILRTLGKWGTAYPSNVDSAIAICPPIDLVECAANLRQRGNRIYEKYFVDRMSEQLVYRRRKVKDLVDNGLSPLPNRLIHFDDQFTAPIWGYPGAIDYYEDASSAPWLSQIEVPTIILTAKDDPVVPFSMFDNAELSSFVDIVAPNHGGHLGFLGVNRHDPDRHWMDWRICQWITALDERSDIRRHDSAQTSLKSPHTRTSRSSHVANRDYSHHS